LIPDDGTKEIDTNHAPFKRRHHARLNGWCYGAIIQKENMKVSVIYGGVTSFYRRSDLCFLYFRS